MCDAEVPRITLPRTAWAHQHSCEWPLQVRLHSPWASPCSHSAAKLWHRRSACVGARCNPFPGTGPACGGRAALPASRPGRQRGRTTGAHPLTLSYACKRVCQLQGVCLQIDARKSHACLMCAAYVHHVAATVAVSACQDCGHCECDSGSPQVGYGVSIVSFLGGIHWAMAMAEYGGASRPSSAPRPVVPQPACLAMRPLTRAQGMRRPGAAGKRFCWKLIAYGKRLGAPRISAAARAQGLCGARRRRPSATSGPSRPA